jgi:hypothetical protein
MTYTFRGGLRASLADGVEESLSGVEVRLYRVRQDDEVHIRKAAMAQPKETFSILSPAAVDEKRSALLADGKTDENGQFAVEIDDGAEFTEDESGRPAVFTVDVRVESIPGSNVDPERPVQFTLTTHQPRWRETETGVVADWDATIPRRNWCAVLEEAGIWMVCGRVTICDTTDPVGGLTVTARDADIIQHDQLGTGVTDSNGQFCIYYSRSDFEETPPPWGPIELIPGPDLYFSIEHSGQTRLDEDPSRGRKGSRENAGHCEYVELCVDPREPDDGGGTDTTPVPTVWRRIGSAFDVTTTPQQSIDFDAEGYAGGKKYALTGQLTMEGSAPLFHTESPDQFVEYRLLVSENPTSNGGPTPTGFQPVGVGSGRYRSAFGDGVTVGEVYAYDPSSQLISPVPVDVDSSHLDSSGWVSVRDAVDDALGAALGTDLQTLRSNNHYFGWNDSDPLASIDTGQFTDEPDVENASAPGDPVPDAGDPVPQSRRIGVEKIAIKFEARVVDASGQVVTSPPSPGSVQDTTLNAVVVNNNRAFARFVNVDHEQRQDRCEKLSGDVELAYTVHHPHLAGVRLVVRRNDGASEHLDDPNNEVSFDPSFSFTSGPGGSIHQIRHFDDSGLPILRTPDPNRSDDPILTEKCGYVARLRVRPRLHNGYTAWNWQTRGSSIFYWEGASP